MLKQKLLTLFLSATNGSRNILLNLHQFKNTQQVNEFEKNK